MNIVSDSCWTCPQHLSFFHDSFPTDWQGTVSSANNWLTNMAKTEQIYFDWLRDFGSEARKVAAPQGLLCIRKCCGWKTNHSLFFSKPDTNLLLSSAHASTALKNNCRQKHLVRILLTRWSCFTQRDVPASLWEMLTITLPGLLYSWGEPKVIL